MVGEKGGGGVVVMGRDDGGLRDRQVRSQSGGNMMVGGKVDGRVRGGRVRREHGNCGLEAGERKGRMEGQPYLIGVLCNRKPDVGMFGKKR